MDSRYAPVRTGSAYYPTVCARTSARRVGKNNTHTINASFVRTHKHWRALHVRPVIVRNSVRLSVRSVAVFTTLIPRVRSVFGVRARAPYRRSHAKIPSSYRVDRQTSVHTVIFRRTMSSHRGVVAYPWWFRWICSGTFPRGSSTTTILNTTVAAAAASVTTTTITPGQHQRPAVRG